MNKYYNEAREKWGETKAFKESEEKSKNRTAEEEKSLGGDMMNILKEFRGILNLSPDSSEAQRLVQKLQSFITENYYNCTSEILAGLGQMYVYDERFKNNIDSVGGEGTAEFVNKAIEIYCKERNV